MGVKGLKTQRTEDKVEEQPKVQQYIQEHLQNLDNVCTDV